METSTLKDSKGLNSLWFMGVEKDAKEKLTKTLYASYDMVALVRLKKVLLRRLDELENKETSTEVYNNPNWASVQADLNGAKREIKRVLSLLDFVKD